jgi:hypothetical protein
MFRVNLVYAHPDLVRDVVVTTTAESQIDQLWKTAKAENPNLANHIGAAECIFYIVCSSFLYARGGFFLIYSSRPTCLSLHPPPCSLAAKIGFGCTVVMANKSGAVT